MRLGKQARDDGGQDSDNILGDVMEDIERPAELVYRIGANPLQARVHKGECV